MPDYVKSRKPKRCQSVDNNTMVEKHRTEAGNSFSDWIPAKTRDNRMKRNCPAIAASLALLLISGQAWAQDAAEEEPTIRLMGNAEAALPDAVTKEIRLPPGLREDSGAVENANKGLNTANENRNREKGLAIADDARARGAEMSEAAQENRENHGRSDDLPSPPNRPERPQPPGGN
jgi:hypothetical protein